MSTGPAIVERPQHRRKIRLPEVLDRTGLSRSTLYELIENGLFPEQAKAQGTRTAMWWEGEVDDWNESPAKVSPRKVRAGNPPVRPRKELSAGSGTSPRSHAVNGASRQKQGSHNGPSIDMRGLEKTGMTLLGREVYRHVATNRLLLDVGFLLWDAPTPTETSETKTVQ